MKRRTDNKDFESANFKRNALSFLYIKVVEFFNKQFILQKYFTRETSYKNGRNNF